MWLAGAEEHGKSNDTEYCHCDIAIACSRMSCQLKVKLFKKNKKKDKYSSEARFKLTSFSGPVGHETGENRQHGRNGIWRNAQKLSVDVLVAHLRDDGGQKKRETVECAVTAHVDYHAGVCLPVFQACPQVIEFELLMFGTGLLVELQSTDDSAAVVVGKEFGLIREVVDLELIHQNHPQSRYLDNWWWRLTM